jgi:hypothetical protein
VKASRESGGGGGENARATNLSSEEPNMNDVLLTVDFGTPSYKFIVNICTYLIF